jgi:hypothetical protein
MDELRHFLNCEEWLDPLAKLRNENRKTKSKGAKEISLKLNRPRGVSFGERKHLFTARSGCAILHRIQGAVAGGWAIRGGSIMFSRRKPRMESQ